MRLRWTYDPNTKITKTVDCEYSARTNDKMNRSMYNIFFVLFYSWWCCHHTLWNHIVDIFPFVEVDFCITHIFSLICHFQTSIPSFNIPRWMWSEFLPHFHLLLFWSFFFLLPKLYISTGGINMGSESDGRATNRRAPLHVYLWEHQEIIRDEKGIQGKAPWAAASVTFSFPNPR